MYTIELYSDKDEFISSTTFDNPTEGMLIVFPDYTGKPVNASYVKILGKKTYLKRTITLVPFGEMPMSPQLTLDGIDDYFAKFPPLYQCEKCGEAVKVTNQGVGVEPIIKRKCKCPEDTPILARRKVTLRGKGQLNHIKKAQIKVTLTLRQFLSYITGRSI